MRKSIIALLLTVFINIPTAQSATRHPNVIIIGAGIAGLSAAQTLVKHHIPVLVLEARNRIGGRIHTVYPWGPGLDLGASWIHGINHNPIKTITTQNRITTVPTAYNDNTFLEKFKSFKLYNSDGMAFNKTQLAHALILANQFDEENHPDNQSLEDAFTKFISLHPVDEQTQLLLRYIITNIFLYEFGADLFAISEHTNALYAHSQVSGQNELFPYGFSQILPSLAANIPIELNQQVIKIEYNHNGVEVSTQNQHYHADYVIITVPLGVLKSGTIRFTPSLPQDKQNAINQLAMATYNKIYLFFAKPFWDKQFEWIGYIPESQRMQESPDIMNFYKFTQSPILLFFTAGSFGKEISHWDETKKLDYMMTILKKIYGNNIPRPSSYIMTNWDSDPFSYGAYSYLPIGADVNSFKVLAQPVMNKLFFAGEATSTTDPGTVHGAFLTGDRAAKEIINTIKKATTYEKTIISE
jgi:monoamine oxidase